MVCAFILHLISYIRVSFLKNVRILNSKTFKERQYSSKKYYRVTEIWLGKKKAKLFCIPLDTLENDFTPENMSSRCVMLLRLVL